MKVENQLPVVAGLEPSDQRPAGLREAPSPKGRRANPRSAVKAPALNAQGGAATLNLQLNQQLSSMQSAESYLDQLSSRLRQLKLSLSRELSGAQGGDREGLQQAIRDVEQLLSDRASSTGGALDSSLRLRISEPARSSFSILGIENVAQVQEAGKETLLFSAGRSLNEPLAVVLDDGMSAEAIVAQFNSGLGQSGIRADLGQGGALRFSARESDWQDLRGQLTIQGEGKLAGKSRSVVQVQEEELVTFPAEASAESLKEMRRVLENVVAALDRVGVVRDQLVQRKKEIREFLARQSEQSEGQWALELAGQVFNLMQQAPSSYAAVSQTVVAQANLSRSSVVSLLH